MGWGRRRRGPSTFFEVVGSTATDHDDDDSRPYATRMSLKHIPELLEILGFLYDPQPQVRRIALASLL